MSDVKSERVKYLEKLSKKELIYKLTQLEKNDHRELINGHEHTAPKRPGQRKFNFDKYVNINQHLTINNNLIILQIKSSTHCFKSLLFRLELSWICISRRYILDNRELPFQRTDKNMLN